MFNRIYALAASGQEFTVLQDVYFEAALKFALEHGGKLDIGVKPAYAQDVSMPINIGGTNYLVLISRMPSGNTLLMLHDSDEGRRKFRERIGLS